MNIKKLIGAVLFVGISLTSFAQIPTVTGLPIAPSYNDQNPSEIDYAIAPRIMSIPNADGSIDMAWKDQNSNDIFITKTNVSRDATQHISVPSLGLLGGFIKDPSGNYYVLTTIDESGIINPTSVNRSNVAVVHKLDPNGNLLWTCDLKGSGPHIWSPMKFGTARIAYQGGEICVHMAQRQPDTHELTFYRFIDATTGNLKSDHYAGTGHSLNSRLQVEGSEYVSMELGDAYWRGITIRKSDVNGYISEFVAHRTKGSLGQQPVFADLGGIQKGPNSYVVAFITEPGAIYNNGKLTSSYNVAIANVKHDFSGYYSNPNAVTHTVEQTNYGSICPPSGTCTHTNELTWLTNYTDPTKDHAQRPQLLKVGVNRFVLMWEHWDATSLKGMYVSVIDELGNFLVAPKLYNRTTLDGTRLLRSDDVFLMNGQCAWVQGLVEDKTRVLLNTIDDVTGTVNSQYIKISGEAIVNRELELTLDERFSFPSISTTLNLIPTIYDDNVATVTYSWQQLSGPGTANFTSSTTAVTDVNFTMEGRYALKLTVQDGVFSVEKIVYVDAGTPAIPIVPCLIECEDYKDGGQGVAYHDVDVGNTGGVYRNDDVDLYQNGTEIFIAWIETGEWITYDIDVLEAGLYHIKLKTGYKSNDIRVLLDGVDVSGTLTTPGSGPGNWWPTYVEGLNLTQGVHEVRIEILDDKGTGLGLDNFEIIKGNKSSRYEAELLSYSVSNGNWFNQNVWFNADQAGEGEGYNDYNQGRLEGINVGDYVEYTLNVPVTGDYRIDFTHSMGNSFGNFKILVDGQDQLIVYNGYYNEDIEYSGLEEIGIMNLTSGNHVIRQLVVGKNNLSSNYTLGIDRFELTLLDVSDYPIATTDVLVTTEDVTSATIDLLANDFGNNLSVSSIGLAQGGQLTLNGSNIQFIPTTSFTGTQEVEYVITDGIKTTNGKIIIQVKEATTRIETEYLPVSPTITGSGTLHWPWLIDWWSSPVPNLSDKGLSHFTNTSNGDVLSMVVNFDETGYYDIDFGHVISLSASNFDVAIDGVSWGTTINGYSSNPSGLANGGMESVNKSLWKGINLTAGNHVFTFTRNGNDPSMVGDAAITIDYIETTYLGTIAPPHTVTASATSMGSVTLTSQIVADGDASQAILAIQNDANTQVFSHWSGDISSTDNPLVITNVTANMNVVANFVTHGPTHPTTSILITLPFGSTMSNQYEGAVIPLIAPVPPISWLKFDKWIGTGSSPTYVYKTDEAITYYVTPKGGIQLALDATYEIIKDGSIYFLDMKAPANNQGIQYVAPGQVFSISAPVAPVPGFHMVWTGSGAAYVSDINAYSTTITMPAFDVELIPTYVPD